MPVTSVPQRGVSRYRWLSTDAEMARDNSRDSPLDLLLGELNHAGLEKGTGRARQ
jgi:hypothetical protein